MNQSVFKNSCLAVKLRNSDIQKLVNLNTNLISIYLKRIIFKIFWYNQPLPTLSLLSVFAINWLNPFHSLLSYLICERPLEGKFWWANSGYFLKWPFVMVIKYIICSTRQTLHVSYSKWAHLDLKFLMRWITVLVLVLWSQQVDLC